MRFLECLECSGVMVVNTFAELTSQKDFFVGVKGVDDQRHQLTDIGGEGEGLDVCGVGGGSWERKNKR